MTFNMRSYTPARQIADAAYREAHMSLHPQTFGYLAPSDAQHEMMNELRKATTDYAAALEIGLPEGPDKTYVMRKLREVAMWVNVALTRNPDGSPRT